MAINFTGEEKIDLLLKKVAYGVSKTGTSESTGPNGEPITSFKAIKPEHIWKEATGSNIPSTPDSGSTSYVGVYDIDGTDTDFDTAGNVQGPVAATAVATSANMPGITFKRAWDTGKDNWIGPAFGSDYAVRVYVGNSGWDGTEAGKSTSSITEVVFGDNPAADWFFDYEAGVLYWTNEEGVDSGNNGDYDDSVNFVNSGSVIANNDVVYITGRQYIGATGVGTDAAAEVTVTQEASADTNYNLVFTSSTSTDNAADLFMNNGDLYWNPSDEALYVGTLILADGSITDTSGSISFGDENLSTTGTITGATGSAFGNLTLADGSITDSNGSISFGDENLSTTGTLSAGVATLGTGSTIGTLTLANGSITDSNGSISFGDENLSTSGTAATGNLSVTGTGSFSSTISAATGSTIGTLTLADGSITDSNGSISFGDENLSTSGTFAAGATTITGDLTVTGSFIQETGTNVIFEDTFLELNVPDTITADITSDSGLRFGTAAASASALSAFAQMAFDNSADKFKFTREADGGTFSDTDMIDGADNVAALKFDVTTTSLGAEAAATNDLADLYGTANTARSNNSNVRSLGAVSKCTIDITTDSSDDGSNYAPVAAASNGYPIQHDLGTSSVFVFALKTHQAGADGSGGAATQIGEPQPIFCKFKVLTSDIVEVSVGITKENEKYDIIVIG